MNSHEFISSGAKGNRSNSEKDAALELSARQSPATVIGPDDHFVLNIDGEFGSSENIENTDPRTTVLCSGGQLPAVEEVDASFEGIMLGRFRLQKMIARGGMGIIVEARDLDLDREVAIKLLRRQHQARRELHEQFTNEARITGRLQHPGIVPIYETGTTPDDRPYFAMKMVRGKTLGDLLAARESPQDDLPRLLHIFEQVCQTLSYTHSCGVIHLDVKPSNIMVGAFGEVHLMDWGLARASTDLCVPISVQNRNTRTQFMPDFSGDAPLIHSHDLETSVPEGAIRGTPAYMSPEQAHGQCSDVRSDVFGLGGILCEILTGSPPYPGANFREVFLKASRADLDETYAKLVNSGAAEVLVRLALKCLSLDMESRPADAGIVASELMLYLESVLERANSDLERFFDLSLDLFCIAGLDGYFRRVNSNFPRVLGHSEKELMARPFMDFVHPDDRERTVEVMSQLLQGQPVVRFQNRYQTAAGDWRCFEWTAKSVPEDEIIFAAARDVTEHSQA